MNLLQRARDCELGKDVKALNLPSTAESHDDEPSWAPSGNVNVRFTDVETLKKQQNKQLHDEQSGFVNVRFRQPKEDEILSKQKTETPKLNFPNEKLPLNLDDHDKKYEEALKNTNEYKKKLAELENQKVQKVSSEFINSGLDSLVKAGTLSASTFNAGGIASGKVEKVPMNELEKELDIGESVVTSSPLILVTKGNKTSNEGCAGRSKITITKTIRYEKILTLLGEEPDSDGVKEIRDLINAWQSNFRKKVVTAKDKAKNKEIETALEELVSQFDDINLKLIKDQANATFTSEDYPHDDAEIIGNNCDALPESTSITEEKPIELAELKDENGNVVIIDDGIAKIKIGNEGEISENLDEASRTETKEEPIEWHNEEYRKEIENFRKTHHINFNNATSTRNDTTCDAYMRCRAQMHVAVDQCAWNFASSKVITSLAESSESLLFKNDEVCDSSHITLYEELYEMVIQRNTKLRQCLDERNEKAFSESICLPYNKAEQQVYDHALLRVLANKYTKAMDCYQDANSIQEKCSKLRQCCPYFDSCREQMIDVNLEQAIISMTARINDEKQSCIKLKARDSFKKAVKGILGRTDEESLQLLRSGRYGLDIKKGAQLMRRLR
ncbi:unnamed protein product [Auanema sp. JU1783]|nr:unnamed protein product [Auanema sp. JU1783]